MPSDLLAVIRDACAETLALLLPVTCAGCDEPDVLLCELCTLALVPRPRQQHVEASGGVLTVWSGLEFDGVAARVIRAIKEDGRTGLARSLAPALDAALARVEAPGAILVPLPTSRAAYRRRGFRVPELIVRRARHPVHRLLHHTRRTRDQRGLDRGDRRRNVEGSLVVRVPTPPPGAAGASPGASGRVGPAAGLSVVLVDDVVTTGATLAEAARAMRAAGADVVAAVTVAATPRRLARPGERTSAIFQTHR